MSHNPESQSHFDTSFTESDDIFDPSYSFMSNNENASMDYYIAGTPLAPDFAKSPETNTVLEGKSGDTKHNQFSLSPLTLQNNIQPLDMSGQSYYGYPAHSVTYQQQQSPATHPAFFHPYRSRTTGDLSRPTRASHSPHSPALSSSHGSLNSNRLSFSAQTAVSPTLVSPHGITGSLEASPTVAYGAYGYPFYHNQTSVNPISNMSPTGPGLSMVAGFPYPTGAVPQSPLKGPTRNLRSSRAKGGRRKVKQQDVMSDDDDDDVSAKGGLGLTNGSDDDLAAHKKDEVTRRGRIQSEQKRRDELREGFKRLKEALPNTNQRASKSNLLDRSVAHIQAIEGANRYLLTQLDEQQKECAKLRDILHGEVMHRTASNSPDQPGARHH